MNTTLLALLLIFLWMLLLPSCKKSPVTGEEDIAFREMSIPSGNEYFSLFHRYGRTYLPGGKRGEKSLVWTTDNKGKTWEFFSIPEYKSSFFSTVIVNESTAFLGGDSLTIYYTRDAGKTWLYYWYRIPDEWVVHAKHRVPLLDFHFVNDSVGFATGGREFRGGIILKTTSAGHRWNPTPVDAELRDIHFTDERTGFAAGYGTVLRTTDAGESWERTGLSGEFFTSISFPSSATGYISGFEGTIYKTIDGGATWKKILEGNRIFAKRLHFNHIHFTDENTGYAAGEKGVLLITRNGGLDWKLYRPFGNISLRSCHFFSEKEAWFVAEGGKIFETVFP